MDDPWSIASFLLKSLLFLCKTCRRQICQLLIFKLTSKISKVRIRSRNQKSTFPAKILVAPPSPLKPVLKLPSNSILTNLMEFLIKKILSWKVDLKVFFPPLKIWTRSLFWTQIRQIAYLTDNPIWWNIKLWYNTFKNLIKNWIRHIRLLKIN